MGKVLFNRCVKRLFPPRKNELPRFSAVNLVAGLFNQLLFALFYLFDDLLAGFQLRLPFRMTGNALSPWQVSRIDSAF
ncbi:MAG: hypothetical protein WCI64_10335 [Chlorobium sp.]